LLYGKEEAFMASRILFLCARGSSRSLIAASLLSAQAGHYWEVWSTPAQDAPGLQLAEQVLHEQGIALISPDSLIQPTFGMRWDEGIVLCSGAAET
jgi:protein-tyrosine-phosphatase